MGGVIWYEATRRRTFVAVGTLFGVQAFDAIVIVILDRYVRAASARVGGWLSPLGHGEAANLGPLGGLGWPEELKAAGKARGVVVFA